MRNEDFHLIVFLALIVAGFVLLLLLASFGTIHSDLVRIEMGINTLTDVVITR